MKGLKILVIDDSAASAAAIRLAVTREPGWSIVGHAHDAAAALELCGALDPDVMTLDLSMPGSDGLDMLSALRNGCDTPVVVVSASTYEGSPVTGEALARGADACFDKAKILLDAPALLRLLFEAARDGGRLAR